MDSLPWKMINRGLLIRQGFLSDFVFGALVADYLSLYASHDYSYITTHFLGGPLDGTDGLMGQLTVAGDFRVDPEGNQDLPLACPIGQSVPIEELNDVCDPPLSCALAILPL